MSKHGKRWGVGLAVATACLVGLVGTVRAQEGDEQKVLEAFQKGIELYQTAQYPAARQAFAQVLAMQPGMAAALRMHDMADLSEFFEMRNHEELKDQADRLLDLMTRAARERKRAVPDADQLVRDFQAPELATYVNARVRLVGHGPYAVPYVVGLLALDKEGQEGIVARTQSLLKDLHRDACLPLTRVLLGSEDGLLKARVAGVLARIGDRRAVPALMAAAQDPNSLEDLKRAAVYAAESITGSSVSDLGSAADQYVWLGIAYLSEDQPQVGYTYALTADVWQWNAAGADLAHKVVFQEVPSPLYYQRMASEVALEGLASAPANADLQALLGAALVRELARCELVKSAGARLGGQVEAGVVEAASARAAELAVETPVVLRMLRTPVVAQALQMTLGLNDGTASLYLVKTLGDKLSAGGPGSLDIETAAALVAALDSGDKDVRYGAATALVSASPAGDLVPPEQVVAALGAALQAAADRNALVIMDNFQMRNKLVTVLREEGMATTECGVLEGRILQVLALEPSVDIIFLAGNGSAEKVDPVYTMLKADPRTKGAALYMVVDPADEAPDMAPYEGVEGVLSPDDLRSVKLQPILKEKVFAQSRSAFTEDEKVLVLKAARALQGLNQPATQYDLAALEPAVLKALSGYGEEVTSAAVACLSGFGSAEALGPLSQVVSGSGSVPLKVSACRATAAVLQRTKAAASEDVVAVLTGALRSQDQGLREAAAEALGVSGLAAEDLMALLRKEGLRLP